MSCATSDIFKSGNIPSLITVNFDVEFAAKYNAETTSDSIIIKKSTVEIAGYSTHNKRIFDDIIKPAVTPKLDELKKLPKHKIVSELALLTFNVYQKYIGKSFYRWGGDIFDLDDPQNRSIRFSKSYGLDCSGFSSAGYELAVYFNLLSPEEALFSSKGFERYCALHDIEDSGGRENTPNNFRVDTKELAFLGDEVFRIEHNTFLTDEKLRHLQAGDIMGKNGHFGILVEIDNELYYLESGGWVLSKNDEKPTPIREAVQTFAKQGTIFIRRCLPTF